MPEILERHSAPAAPSTANERPKPRFDFPTGEAMILNQVAGARQVERVTLMSVASWVSAFSNFKLLRRNMGLPEDKSSLLSYGVLLANLKSSGKLILFHIEQGHIDIAPLGIDKRNFEACIEELKNDDLVLDLGLLERSDAEVDAPFELKTELAPVPA